MEVFYVTDRGKDYWDREKIRSLNEFEILLAVLQGKRTIGEIESYAKREGTSAVLRRLYERGWIDCLTN